MAYTLAVQLLNLLCDLGAKNVVFIGGEPTLYRRLPELGRMAQTLGLQTALVTNGIRTSDKRYCLELRNAGITNITISLKGASDDQYYDLAGAKGFSRVLRGVENLRQVGIQPNFEITVVKDYLPHFDGMLHELICQGIKNVTFDLASPAVSGTGTSVPGIPNPRELGEAVEKIYECLNGQDIDYVIYLTIPFCLVKSRILAILKEEGRIISGCHVPHGSAAIFDEDGRLLACNHLSSYPLGQFGEDFSNRETFLAFWNNHAMNEFRKTCSRYPSSSCQSCARWEECGGGCLVKWLHWDPREYIGCP